MTAAAAPAAVNSDNNTGYKLKKILPVLQSVMKVEQMNIVR